jgi:hypothetical protein
MRSASRASSVSRGRGRPRRQRVELLHELPVAGGEPQRRERARERRRPECGAAAEPPTSGTRRTSQTRNCGESTLLSATKATTDGGRVSDEPLDGRGAPANETHTSASAAAWAMPWSTASASAPVPARFCEPLPDAHSRSILRLVQRRARTPRQALDLERPAELASERVEHAVRADDAGREVGDGTVRGRARRRRRARVVLPRARRRPEKREEHAG